MATAEGVFPKIGNDPLFNSEINFFGRPVQQVYTGNGFNSSATNTTDEGSFELTAVTSALATPAEYVKVKITGTSKFDKSASDSTSGNVKLKAQIKETGQSYADIISFRNTIETGITSTVIDLESTSTYEIIATLTAGMKTNGFQVKVFSESISSGTAVTVSFINIQTVVELA